METPDSAQCRPFRLRIRTPCLQPNKETEGNRKTNKQYLRSYRERLRTDQAKYNAHLEQERLRLKEFRANRQSEEQKERNRVLQRERQRRYREKKRAETKGQPPPPPPIITRGKQKVDERKREKNRAAAQKLRDRYTPQKRTAVNKKRRKRYWDKKSLESQPLATSTSKSPGSTADAPYPTKTAYKTAVHRLRQKLSNLKGLRLAQTLKGFLKSQDTPTKAALRTENISIISPTSAKVKLAVSDYIEELKPKRDKASIAIKRKLIDILPSSGKKKQTHKHMDSLYKKNAPTKAVVEDCLRDFATDLPGKNTVLKTEQQKQILSESLIVIHKKIKQGKKISLRSFYRHRPKHMLSSCHAKFRQCLCDICYNAQSKLRALNLYMHEKVDVSDVLSLTMCDICEGSEFQPIKCVRRECESCGCERVKKEFISKLKDNLESNVSFSEWKTVKDDQGKSKMDKILRRVTLKQLLDELFSDLGPLALHQFNSKWQRMQYQTLKQTVPSKEVVLTLDFAENYLCKVQDEAQSAYWSYTQITVHPIVATFKCPVCHESCVHHLVFLTDELKHDPHVVHEFLKRSLTHLQTLICVDKVYLFSDGASSQYKSKLPFYYLSKSPVAAEKVFFGSRHGKSECDAVGGTVKSLLSRLAASQHEISVKDASSAFQQCTARFRREEKGGCGFSHKSREFFLVPEDEIIRHEPENLKTLPGTRSLHHVKFMKKNVLAIRKLACFCAFCLLKVGSHCIYKDWVGEWCEKDFDVSLDRADKAQGVSEGEIDCKNVASSVKIDDAKGSLDRIKVGSFYLVLWNGKDYVAQVKEKDNLLVKLSFLSWRNGQLQWGKEDFSWESYDIIGAEVQLTLNERASNQRVQVYNYSFMDSFKQK